MKFQVAIKEIVRRIEHDPKAMDAAILELSAYLAKNPLPASERIRTINNFKKRISGKKSPEEIFIETLTGTTKLSDIGKIVLPKMLEVVENSKPVKCEHKNIGVFAFANGGGFSCVFLLFPEAICLDCYHNHTMVWNSQKEREREGIMVCPEELYKEIFRWSQEVASKQEPWISVRLVCDDPAKAIKAAPRFPGDISKLAFV